MSDCGCYSHGGFLTAKGLEETALRSSVGPELAGRVATRYLDRVGSVSGLRRDEITMIFNDGVLDEQHRRFLEQLSEAV